MKKILSAFFAAVMFFGLIACRKSPADSNAIETAASEMITGAPVESSSQPLSFSIYIPNANADGFYTETIHASEISADTVLSALKNRNVLPDTIAINSFRMDNGSIAIDFNQAFADAVCALGTSGEFLIVGSVVNTFLDAFQAESVYFTVDDQILESGHTIYDFSMTFFDP